MHWNLILLAAAALVGIAIVARRRVVRVTGQSDFELVEVETDEEEWDASLPPERAPAETAPPETTLPPDTSVDDRHGQEDDVTEP